MNIIGGLGVILDDVFDRQISYLSIDPGVMSGVTLWTKAGEPIIWNELNIDSMNELLDEFHSYLPLGDIIIEEFVLYQKTALALSGSRLETVQVIGMCKRFAHTERVNVHEIRADAKGIAAQWAGMKVPKGHMPNWQASYLIGYYHLHKTGVIPPRVLDAK